MRKRVIYGSGLLLLAILFALIIWQGSFDFGDYGPSSPGQTYTLWALSTINFVLVVTLGFMLVRNFIKLYVERRSDRIGSRIRTKLVYGAVALTCMPVLFLVLFSIQVLNRNLDKWFSKPAEHIKANLIDISSAISAEHQAKARAQAEWAAGLPAVREGRRDDTACREHGVAELAIRTPDGAVIPICSQTGGRGGPRAVTAVASVPGVAGAEVRLTSVLPIDMARIKAEIERELHNYEELARSRKMLRWNYIALLTLITLFILFFANWIALFLARQISVPISALLAGAEQVRSGNLAHRVQVKAIDELAMLVRAFNDMTADLQANSLELEKRRRFTEAILESIPTGVISLTYDRRILRVNRALKGILPADQVDRATRLEDLFPPDDAKELRYLMNRARRMGLAGSQFEFRTSSGQTIPLSVTVAALEERGGAGFVLVLEDTSDLLRAQKFAAWHEIARRIAHEIKNPLTPIALCAERIARQLSRRAENPDADRILRECSAMISAEVETLRSLVDEFSQFARFPAAQPQPSDLNEIVENALAVFHGRLADIDVRTSLAPNLPLVNIDREHFKRLVVNLVDNAAEAMDGCLVRQLAIATAAPGPDTVELMVADTGCGISPEDKEKLFLPYFSTKGRGTGLGLAIVNHIVSEHGGHIRVEDNQPAGARFVVDIPAVAAYESLDTSRPVEART
ncbi:MAG TPA: ATP-binding protein [Bryobacteraceae bacterium]|nr:ATP-binding protein [Bryobacteraceae bacterium]